MDIELEQPHHLTVGYTGEPGQRTFFLQAEDETRRESFVLEKGQVAGIGELLSQLLARLEDAPATDWDRDAMALRFPLEPRWRVGELSLGIDESAGRFALELVAAGEEATDARVWFDRDQARRLAAHAAEVVARGRPTCELCGRPTAPDGEHVCPATNGHGRLTS